MGIQEDINLVLNAKDNATPQVTSAMKRINDQFDRQQAMQTAVTRGWQLQHQTLTKYLDTLQTVGSVASTVSSIYMGYNIQQLRNFEIQNRVLDTQYALNEAIMQYGPDSIEAEMAARSLTVAQREQSQAAQDTVLQYVAWGFQIAGVASMISGKLLPQLGKLKGALGGGAGTPSTVPGGGSDALGNFGAGAAGAGGVSLLSRLGSLALLLGIPVAAGAGGFAAGYYGIGPLLGKPGPENKTGDIGGAGAAIHGGIDWLMKAFGLPIAPQQGPPLPPGYDARQSALANSIMNQTDEAGDPFSYVTPGTSSFNVPQGSFGQPVNNTITNNVNIYGANDPRLTGQEVGRIIGQNQLYGSYTDPSGVQQEPNG